MSPLIEHPTSKSITSRASCVATRRLTNFRHPDEETITLARDALPRLGISRVRPPEC